MRRIALVIAVILLTGSVGRAQSIAITSAGFQQGQIYANGVYTGAATAVRVAAWDGEGTFQGFTYCEFGAGYWEMPSFPPTDSGTWTLQPQVKVGGVWYNGTYKSFNVH